MAIRRRVINLVNLDQILLMDTSGSTNHYEEVIDRDIFASMYNLDLSDIASFAFEPDRNLYMLERADGSLESFENPEDHPLMATLAKEADNIFNHFRESFLMARTPKYHVYENGEYILPASAEETYYTEKLQKEAFDFLKNTNFMVIDALEQGVEIPEDIKEARRHAREFLGEELFTKLAMREAGLDPSPGSAQKIKAGIKKHPLAALPFLPENREEYKTTMKKKASKHLDISR